MFYKTKRNPYRVSFFTLRNVMSPLSGLKATSREDNDTASDEMITFLVLNTAGVLYYQLQ